MKKLLLISIIILAAFILQASTAPLQATPQCQNAGGYHVHITGIYGDQYAAAEIRGREIVPFVLQSERTIVTVQYPSTYVIIDNRIAAHNIDDMIVGVFYVPADLPQCVLGSQQPTNYCPPNLPPLFDCAH